MLEIVENKVEDVEHIKKEKPRVEKKENDLELNIKQTEQIKETGEVILNNSEHNNIHLISIIGEIEGHDVLGSSTKSTKYEHILPSLAAIEDNDEVGGVLVLINTVGGDVEAGLAISEMIASLSKPTVSLVLGGSHSIGAPIAVSADYSFIVSTGTMVIHPVRMSGMVLGVRQSFEYFQQIQDRIVGFVCDHSKIEKEQFKKYMMNTEMMTKDLGTLLVGKECVETGLIDGVGGIKEAIGKLHQLIGECKKK
ncbi:MAG: ATP-dependent Clp protease proteolytic subunit [Eubacteriales bacterium]